MSEQTPEDKKGCGCGCDSCPTHGHSEGEDCGCRELVIVEMGLRNFPGPETPCPKCTSEMPKIVFHPYVVISMDEAEHPCAQWAREGLLTSPITEHICVRCNRCGYGYPAKTADSS